MSGPGHHFIGKHFPLESTCLDQILDVVGLFSIWSERLHGSFGFFDLATQFGFLCLKPSGSFGDCIDSIFLTARKVGNILSYTLNTLSLENRFS